MAAAHLSMDKIASLSVHAVSLREIYSTLLGFVFGVGLLILTQFVGAMSELALLLIGAKSKLKEFLAEL